MAMGMRFTLTYFGDVSFVMKQERRQTDADAGDGDGEVERWVRVCSLFALSLFALSLLVVRDGDGDGYTLI